MNVRNKGTHNHIHGVKPHQPAVVSDQPIADIIAKDAALVQDRGLTRANFQGRFRKTTFGDFKGRPGRSDEMSEAKQEDYVFEQAKEEAALAAAELVDAAAATGIVIEPEPANG